jgi:hypothetical protein
MRLVEKRVLSTALSTRQPRVLKQVGKPPPCVKGVGALQPARVVGEGSGPGQELQRRDHPRCEGPRKARGAPFLITAALFAATILAKEISRSSRYRRLSVIQRFNVLCDRSQIRI